jgi:hypothetical protein
MTINQMAGTFILHYWVTAVAIVVDYISRYSRRKKKGRRQELEQQQQQPCRSRRGLDHSESSKNQYSVLYRHSQWLSRRWSSSTLRSTRRAQTPSSPSLHADNVTTMTASTFAVRAGDVSSTGQENSNDEHHRPYPRRSISFSGDVDIIAEEEDDDERGQDDVNLSSSLSLSLSSSEEMWKRTQEELLETKTELRETKTDVQDTRREMMERMDLLQDAGREMREQMETILKLLRDGKE